MCPVKSNGRAARCGEPRGKTRDFRRENSGCALRGKSPQAVPKRRAFPETHRYPGLGTPPRLIFNSFRSDSYPTSTQEHSFVLTELCEVMEVFPGGRTFKRDPAVTLFVIYVVWGVFASDFRQTGGYPSPPLTHCRSLPVFLR